MSKPKKQVLSVKEVIQRDRKFFSWWQRDVNIVRTFFREVMKVLISGQEVRLPKQGNGTFRLVVSPNYSFYILIFCPSNILG